MTDASGVAVEGSPAEVWDRRHGALTVGLLATVAFSAFESLAVATVMPIIVDELGGLALYGWVFSAFMLGSLIGITASGGLADRRGPAVPFTAGVALFVAGLLVAGFAGGMPALVGARVVQGLGAGAIGAIAYVAVSRGYAPAARPRMIALLSSAWVIPGLIGPALAGVLADLAGWRWVFLGLAPASILGGALAVPSLRRLDGGPRENSRTETSLTIAAVQLAIGVAFVLVGLERPGLLWASALLVAGGVLAAPALRKLLPSGTLTAEPGLPASVALIGLAGFAFFGAEAFVPLALSAIRGESVVVAGLPLTVGTLAWTVGSWIQDHQAERRSRRVLAGAGFVAIGLGVAATSLVLLPSVPSWFSGISWGITSLGMGIAYSTAALVVLECAVPGEEGRASAAMQLSVTLGTALGTGLAGAILALVTGGGAPEARAIALVDAVMVGAAMLGLLACRRIPRSRAEAR